MYRPLYWFGDGVQPTLNPSLSVANYPTFSGKNVTITLKPYKWSNGTPVTATDVAFWINMEQAVGATDYGAYSGFPNTEISNLKVVSPTELTFTMDKAYSPTWLVYNDLSQVTPMPAAWDRTGSGPSNCATTVSDCAAVYKYLDSQSKALTSYVSSPMWSIVDGPWKLSAFNADGHVTFVPNTVLLRAGQAEAVRVPGGAVHHRRRRVRRAAVAEFQQQDRRGLRPGRRTFRPSRPTRWWAPTRWRAVTRWPRCTPGGSTTTR